MMWLCRQDRAAWPRIGAFHTLRKAPRLLQRLSGGVFREMDSWGEAGSDTPCARGWYLYGGPDASPSGPPLQGLCQATHLPAASALWAIMLAEDYLALWTDNRRLGKLLEAAVGVSHAFSEGRPASTREDRPALSGGL